jgi:hypothetical protein
MLQRDTRIGETLFLVSEAHVDVAVRELFLGN